MTAAFSTWNRPWVRKVWKGVSVWTVALICCAAGTAALAQDDTRAWDAKDLTQNDFEGLPPKNPPVEDGVPLRAQSAISVTPNTTFNSLPDAFTLVSVKVVAELLKKDSWMLPPDKNNTNDPDNKKLLDHEKGHLDLAQQIALKAQAEINAKLKKGEIKGKKDDPEAKQKADMEKQIDDIIDRVRQEVEDKNKDKKDDYDIRTGHGTKPKEQAEERAKQKAALGLPNKNAASQKGPQLKSESKKSVSFDAGLGRLTIDHDVIIGVLSNDPAFVPDPTDPILGAQLTVPTFSLDGRTSDGEYFFRADGVNPRLRLTDGSVDFFSADLDYLMYDPLLNMFYGLTRGFETVEGPSHYIDEMVKAGTTGDLALFGVEFLPDHDFLVATAGFTASASDSFLNGAGQRLVASVPEPSSWMLFGIALLVLLGRGPHAGGSRVRVVKSTSRSRPGGMILSSVAWIPARNGGWAGVMRVVTNFLRQRFRSKNSSAVIKGKAAVL